MTPLAQIDPKKWADTLTVNLTANWRFIRSLDPLLRLSTARRAVLISSSAAHKARAIGAPTPSPRPRWKCWRAPGRRKPNLSNLKVNLFNPGPTRTRMRAKACIPGRS